MIPNVSAETFIVTRTDDPTPNGCDVDGCSLREAIIAANDDNSENHTIQLTGGLTYTLSISGDVFSGPVIIEDQEIGLDEFSTNDEEGALKILNTDRTIRIESTGGGMAEIDADGTGPVFMILDETVAELDGLEITGGDTSKGGGLIVAYNESLTITNSLITGNIARSRAAGMDVYGGNVVIEDSEISLNESISDGVPLAGAMSLDRAPLYQEVTTIAELQDIEWVQSNVTIRRSDVSNNTAEVGGAFDITRSTLNVIESTVSGNRAYARGAGFYISRGAIVNIDRSTISGNIARDEEGDSGRGAGIMVIGIQDSDEAAEVFIINSTISGNDAGGAGAGILVDRFGAKTVNIINTTITGNTGSFTTAGGVQAYGGTLNIANSIIANQAAGDDCQISDGGVSSGEPLVYTSLGHNLESETSCDFTETGDLQNLEPFLGPLQDNGGPVFTHALSTDPLSPAINAGSNSLYTNADGDLSNDSDANGNDRVYDFGSGGIIDIGAFELQQEGTVVGCPVTHEDKILFVKKGETGTGANWSNALGELRDALAFFEDETCTTDDVEEIWVTAGTYLPTDDSGDREATFLMQGVNIYGGFEGDETNENQRDAESNISILSGDIDGNDTDNNFDNHGNNSYHVVTSMDEDSGALFGFTITGGNANGTAPHDKGGGLYASNGGISMGSVLFENNYAETAGGGAYVVETVERIGAQHPAFVRSTFRNNESGEDGGGLALEDAESRITSVMFENNDAGRYGGGLFNDGADPVLKNVIFKENSSDLEGGGILNNLSSPELFNVLITDNDAFVNGGGIVNGTNSSPVLTNVTISGNDAENGNGGGMYNRNGAMPLLLNTIVWGNTASSTGDEIWNSSNSSIEIDYSLYGNSDDDIVEGDGFTATNSLTSDPVFTDSGNDDFTIQSTSPAINTGDPGTDMSDFNILAGYDEIDLAKNPRVYDGDVDIIDMGAYEFQGEPTDGTEFAPFITTWDVEAGDLQITIPTAAAATYNYDVDWGDGESDTGQTGDASHTYDSEGTYTVKITGMFPQIEFGNNGDKDKILSVEQWGDIEWGSMRKAFQGATNLVINAADEPDLSNATSMLEMFSGATSVNNGLENWDVSTITSMFGLFDGATSFNGDISEWNVSAATDMIRMFAGATAFNRDISEWVVENVNTMESMFDGATAFNRDISEWDTGSVGGMLRMFTNAAAFNQNLGNWDIEDVTSMSSMLDGSGLSTENYDATLTGWAAKTVQSEVELGADGLTYCSAEADRQSLITDDSWDILGDDLAESCGDEPVVLDAPTLTSPSDESTDIGIPVTLEWNSVDGATSYQVQVVEETGSFETSDFDDETTNTEIEVSGLDPSMEYKWRVRSLTGEDESEWSEVWTFTTGTDDILAAPTLSSPSDEATDIELPVTLEWNTVEDADSYQIQAVEESGSFDTPDFDNETSDTDIEVTGLATSTEYKWRVRSLTSEDQSEWSSVWTFTTEAEVVELDAPTLSSPSDEATDIDRPVTLAWNSVDGAESYSIQLVEESGSFGTPDFDDTASDTDIEVPGLSPFTEYKWRVRAQSGETQSEWSSVWTFTTSTEVEELGIPQLSSPSDEASDVDLTVMLDWDATSGAESYQAQLVEESGSFDTPDFDDETTDTGIEVSGLSPSTEYKWRVRALTSEENGDWSAEWTFTTTGLPEGEDQRILVRNDENHIFSKSNFGISSDDFSIKIESLPDEGGLEYDGDPVEEDDEISADDINNDMLKWNPAAGEYGYNYTSFDFTIVDDNDLESEDSYTLIIDLVTVAVELSGSEGWRFMTNPSDGDSYNDMFSGITVETGPPPAQTLYELDQQNYEWDPVGSTSKEPGVGTPFIAYLLAGDLPVTIEFGENWEDLDGSFSYSGLSYDNDGSTPNPGNFYFVGNPHPIALDFCQFNEENIATSAYFWNPNSNGGNGDYIDLNCATPDDVFIAPFQSFWIRTTDANPGLEIPMEAYLEDTTEGYFKEKTDDEEPFLITLNVSREDGIFTNQAQILFTEEAKEGLDRLDAPKLSAEGLASQWLSFHSMDQDGRRYAFQSLPSSDLSDGKVRIPMDIQTTESGQYTLNWNLPESHMFSGSYFIRDNETGEVIELQGGESYSFDITDKDAIQPKEAETTHPMSEITDNLSSQSNTHRMNSEATQRFELLIAATGIDGLTELGAVPEDFTLAQNYPNPFNPTTVINYQLPVSSEVRLEVYDMLGRQVATLINGQVSAGRHTVNFDASNLSSGVYLYRLVAGSQIMTKKLTILK